MEKPKVFVGSSSEGLRIAEAVCVNLKEDTEPTLWSNNDVFLPGYYFLETLENQLKLHSFAILVASPDDTLVKRKKMSRTMRDNILLEFGLFAGVFGRKRTFLITPKNEHIAIPTDLFGLEIAKYNGELIRRKQPKYEQAIQNSCGQIKQVILNEWTNMQKALETAQEEARKSEFFFGIKKTDGGNLSTTGSYISNSKRYHQQDI